MQPIFTTSKLPVGDGDPDVYTPGTEVVIGAYRFRCTGVLGRGSFSEVWSGEEVGTQEPLEVALKDINCQAKSDLQQALFEANMILSFAAGAACSYSAGSAPPKLRIPRYLSHRVDPTKGSGQGWRVRMAMTRVPGEPLDAFLKRTPPAGQDVQAAVRRGCMLAMQMIRQLAPTLETVSRKAVHRDVNAHNVLLSDAVDGGVFRSCAEPEEAAARANFWLIDFGLAVDSTTWPTAWREADIGGDCRYWPQSSWFVSFWGADEIAAKRDLCQQYVHRLDIFGLGITALELLCTTALDGSNAAGCQSGSSDGLRGSWRRLLDAWTKYWTDVTRWHTMIYRVFSLGGDVGPLYQELAKERVVDKILSRMANIRKCLRQCVNRTEDPRIQSLLSVLAELLDEGSTFGLRDAVNALGGECEHHPVQPRQMQPSPSMNFLPPKPTMPCLTAQVATARAAPMDANALKLQWCAPPMNAAGSFVPPPTGGPCVVQPQAGSFVPPPQQQAGSFVPPPQQLQSGSFVPPTQNSSFVPTPQGGSFVPLPLARSNSFVPPPLNCHSHSGHSTPHGGSLGHAAMAAVAPPTATARPMAPPTMVNAASYAAIPTMPNGSYVPMATPVTAPRMTGGNHSHRAPTVAPMWEGHQPHLKHGPPRTARPQCGGA
jgi:serine/threonine protein kinase